MEGLGRRAFLLLVSLVSAVAPLRGVARAATAGATQASPSALDDFLALSVRLTGRAKLDRGIARTYLDALQSVPGNRQLIADLSSGGLESRRRTPAHVALEQDIIAAWYTGTYEVDGRRHLATHAGALMWSVLGRPAPGICASARASWSRPPRAMAR
ncbi:MAG: sugar dehydrogenase complex small subunit [Vicinamibacterales bacterium]